MPIKKKILELFNKYPHKYFSLQEIKNYTKATSPSLKTVLSRLVKSKILASLSHGFYCQDPAQIDLEQFACDLIYPAYISLESALAHYRVLSQIPASLTLVTTKRSQAFDVASQQMEYAHLKEGVFFGFNVQGNTAMATLEKALLDELYLIGLGKRSLNLNELDLTKINKKRLLKWLQEFPRSTKVLATKLLGR